MLRRLGRKDRERIQNAIRDLPLHGNIKPLKGADRFWRLRVGDWRIRYCLDEDQRVVTVTAVQPRGSAYKP